MARLYGELFASMVAGTLRFEGGPGVTHLRGQVPLAEAVRRLVPPAQMSRTAGPGHDVPATPPRVQA